MAFSQKSCNFSVPGAGKTTIVYAAYTYLRSVNDIDKKVDKLVVIGPKSSFSTSPYILLEVISFPKHFLYSFSQGEKDDFGPITTNLSTFLSISFTLLK
jgi:predicted LPLAT superfamily acyltransferase